MKLYTVDVSLTSFYHTRSHDFKHEKIMLGLKEVEPVEELDLKEVDIDPHMAIWKAMKQSRQQKYYQPEEGKGKFYLPSELQHLAGNKQVEAYHEPQFYNQGQLYQEAEKDLDDVYHNMQGIVSHVDVKETLIQPEIPVPDVVELSETSVYMTPEEDKDGLYHEGLDHFTGQVFQAAVMEDPPKKVYTEPEEDQDLLYHS